MNHRYVIHKHCDCDGYCPICDGGLAQCEVCRGAECSLTTECPGFEICEAYQDQVCAGLLDYRDGQWIETDHKSGEQE